MTIRTILAAASGGSASTGAIELGCRLARRFEAHLEGFHVIADAQAIFAAAGESLGAPSATLIETVRAEAETRAAQTRALFKDVVDRHGIAHCAAPCLVPPWPSATWREEEGNAAALVSRRGRFFDLVVLGRSQRVVREPFSDTIEDTLLRSGRPVLLTPAEPPPGIGYVVAVAWNGSPQSVRALIAALPFLDKASATLLLTAADGDAAVTRDALECLAWHEVNAEVQSLPASANRHPGRALLAAAGEARADMLVMGGYGHTPWREMLFGGATREAIGAMTIPLLLAH